MRSLWHNQRGMTLVEVTVATAVAGLLIILIMTFTVNSFAQISIDSARSDLLREAQISLDTLTQDARLSSNAYTTNSVLDNNVPGGASEWTAGGSVLILATAAQDQDRNILFDDALHYTSYKNNRIYFVDNGTLYRRTLAVGAEGNAAKTTCPANQTTGGCPGDSVLARNVSGFTVRYFDGNGDQVAPNEARSVEVTLELSKRKYSQEVNAKYTTRTVFRNE